MKKKIYICLSVLLSGAALFASCAKDLPESPPVTPEGHVRVGLVLRVEQPETIVSRAAEPQTASQGGLSVALSQGSWNTSPATREGRLTNENVIHDLWVVQTTDSYGGDITDKFYIADIPAPEQTSEGVDYYQLEFDILEAPHGCGLYFFANTGDPELFSEATGYFSDYEASDYVMLLDNEDDLIAGGDIPMYGKAVNPYTGYGIIPIPFPMPTLYDPWPGKYPQEWAGCIVADLQYNVAKVNVTVNWDHVVETVAGNKVFELNSIQIQNVPQKTPAKKIYAYYVDFPEVWYRSYMDYEPVVAPENGATYTWYLPANHRGYDQIRHAEKDDPILWQITGPNLQDNTPKPTRIVLEGTCDGERVVFTIYCVTHTTDYYFNNYSSFYYLVEQGKVYNYDIDISGINPLDRRVEWEGAEEPVPLPADPEYFGTWMNRYVWASSSPSWSKVIISEDEIAYSTDSGTGYTISNPEWTVTRNIGSAATTDYLQGYKMRGTLSNLRTYSNRLMSPDNNTYAVQGGEAVDYWYIRASDKAVLMHGAYYWPGGVVSSSEFRKQAPPEEYFGTWKYMSNTVTIDENSLRFDYPTGGRYFVIEDLVWENVTHYYRAESLTQYDFGYKISGRLAEISGTTVTLSNDNGSTNVPGVRVAEWWYIRDDGSMIMRGEMDKPHEVSEVSNAGYIKQ
jgi:hypothetical protein